MSRQPRFAAAGVEAELELRVGDDDARALGVLGAAAVQRERQVAQPADQLGAELRRRLRLADVLVVPALGLRRGREDRRRQPRRLHQARRQRDAAHRAGALVVLPAGAREVAARHAFDGQRVRAPHQHAAAAQARPRLAGPRRGSRPGRWTAGGSGRGRRGRRTSAPTSATGCGPCRECPSPARSRTPRSDRWPRSAAGRGRPRRRRAPCRGEAAGDRGSIGAAGDRSRKSGSRVAEGRRGHKSPLGPPGREGPRATAP